MKPKVSSWRVLAFFIGAFVPTTMLILGLNSPRPDTPGEMQSQAVHRMAPPHHDHPLIHNLMTSAITIAEHL